MHQTHIRQCHQFHKPYILSALAGWHADRGHTAGTRHGRAAAPGAWRRPRPRPPPAVRGGHATGSVATTGKVVNLKDAYDDKRFNKEIDQQSGYRTKTVLCMAIHDEGSKGNVIGVIQVRLHRRWGLTHRCGSSLAPLFLRARAGTPHTHV